MPAPQGVPRPSRPEPQARSLNVTEQQSRPDHNGAGRLTLPYSSGPVEGNVNRIKMLKRQMYGRAGFALLRKRVILHPR